VGGNQPHLPGHEKPDAEKIVRQGPYEFFTQVKNASHLFQGITDGTMTHGEDWDFIQVGKYLERADMTTRILDANDENLHQATGPHPYERHPAMERHPALVQLA